ncbi:hypothetical protein [Vibrio splendidus]|uniref:hypothetical protein n=1 Tax=Vibrio splendidus TaxID=29497 RepID=UPI002158B5C2|nr:hypothetical protein [Vibrio splendidus]
MTDFNTLFGGDITQFHFMRPLWLLALIPFVLFYRALVQQDDLVAQWQPVMSKTWWNICLSTKIERVWFLLIDCFWCLRF